MRGEKAAHFRLAAERLLNDRLLGDGVIAEVADVCAEGANPLAEGADPLPEPGYKVDLVRATVTKTLERLRAAD